MTCQLKARPRRIKLVVSRDRRDVQVMVGPNSRYKLRLLSFSARQPDCAFWERSHDTTRPFGSHLWNREHTSAFALLYASVHAFTKSGTSQGLSTGGEFWGELAGYTPGIAGPEKGEGKGENEVADTPLSDTVCILPRRQLRRSRSHDNY